MAWGDRYEWMPQMRIDSKTEAMSAGCLRSIINSKYGDDCFDRQLSLSELILGSMLCAQFFITWCTSVGSEGF